MLARSIGRKLELFALMRTAYLPRINGTIVIAYHGVAERGDILDPWVQSLHIDAESFVRQLEFLGRYFDFCSLDDFSAGHKTSRRPAVALTFDDGYKNFLTVVAPILSKRGIPATVFITTNCVSNGSRHPTFMCRAIISALVPGPFTVSSLALSLKITDANRRAEGERLIAAIKTADKSTVEIAIAELSSLLPPGSLQDLLAKYHTDSAMSWDEVREVARKGFTVGSHTLDHTPLHARQPAGEVEKQLMNSKLAITQELGGCKYFAFPNGTPADVTLAAAQAVRTAGYELAFSMVPGIIREGDLERHSHFLPRLGVSSGFDQFRKYVSTAWKRSAAHQGYSQAVRPTLGFSTRTPDGAPAAYAVR